VVSFYDYSLHVLSVDMKERNETELFLTFSFTDSFIDYIS